MQSVDLFGGERCHYLVVAEPDAHTAATVRSLKEAADRKFDIGEHNRHAEPHISLNFSKESTTDIGDDLVKKLKGVLSGVPPFEVCLNGLNDWTHSITWKIDDTTFISELTTRIANATQLKRVEAPHLTLARGVDTATIGISLEPFALYGPFTCSSISLLQKISDAPYKTLVRIDLKDNTPTSY